VHNVIDLPMKWYLGSYGLHIDMLSRYIRDNEEIFPPKRRATCSNPILRVFFYDVQAVVDSFIVMLLQRFRVRYQHHTGTIA
jgi:hypothetical protein